MKHNPKTPKLPLKLVLNEITEQRASLGWGGRKTETEYVCERMKHKEGTYLITLQISNTFSV